MHELRDRPRMCVCVGGGGVIVIIVIINGIIIHTVDK